MSGSLGRVVVFTQCGQVFTIWPDIPGHHTDNLARSRHLWIPWCPLWIFSRVSRCFEAGMTMRVLLRRRLPCRVKFPRASQYGMVTSLSFVLLGHPVRQYLMIIEHRGSEFCACSYSWSLSGPAGRWATQASIASSASSSRFESREVEIGARDKVSVVYRCFPGMWLIE